jgi:hypothetical protein
MELTAARRLPGITFRHEVPAVPDALPRMDIAGFVGLAACGPVHVPVPVEDPGRFREVFGPDLPLAWDAEAGRTATAFLGPAVEAFFRNGGRRAWVVRVARGASVSRFPLPTLLDASTGRPALASARCAGSWADGLRVGAVLHARTLAAGGGLPPVAVWPPPPPPGAPPPARGGVGFRVRVPPGERLAPGDVLRVSVREGEGTTLFFLPVRAEGGGLAETGPGRAFLHKPSEAEGEVETVALGAEGSAGVPVSAVLEASGGRWRLRLGPAGGDLPPVDLAPGQVLRLTPSGGPLAGRVGWASVGEVQPGEGGALAEVTDLLWPLDAPPADPFPAGARVTVEHLTVELVVWEGEQIRSRLGDLGLARSEAPAGSSEREASRFWADLPSDEALFRLEDGRPMPSASALDRAANAPRFSLAGTPEAAALYVPLGMPSAPDREASRGPLGAEPSSALERDGLTDFSPRALLDGRLADVGLGALPATVFDALYVRRQRLEGVHVLWPLEEVTLVAAPDAVQPGWRRRDPPQVSPLAAPRRPEATPLDALGGFRLDWRSPPASEGEDSVFELEEAADALFEGASRIYRGEGTHTHVYFGVEGRCGEDLGCLSARHYRLRMRVGGRVSPWSETFRVDPAPRGFRRCALPPEAPRLRLRQAPLALRWDAVLEASRYVLEAASEPTFFEPTALRLSPPDATSFRLDPVPERVTYYRVRAEGAAGTSPWSGTVGLEPPAPPRWTMRTPEDFDADGAEADLRACHHALLRLGAARGDLVALLSLPAHFRTEQTAAYAAALSPEPTGVARSFGAVYHPWVGVRGESGRGQRVRFLPPDGPLAGLAAARARERGAWVAPANVPLRDVVALAPAFDEEGWARLLAAGVNLVRPTPRGFTPLSSETLAAGPLRPLNVRRLLILLRRLALREGHAFAFESHSAALRQRLALRFEGHLTRLFERGAFAASRPDAAFEVRADAALNPPESVDRGRLLVELRVAPSQPLAFLTVRLVQLDGAGLTVVEA